MKPAVLPPMREHRLKQVGVVRYVAEENGIASPQLAKRANRQAWELSSKVHKAFWDEAVGLYADDETFSRR
ncbi:hypothetical protein D3C84_977440 [compost metagenome]